MRLAQLVTSIMGGGPVSYSAAHDQGSADSVTGMTAVTIVPEKTWNNQWAWWSLLGKRLNGKTPSFAIAKADHYNMAAGMILACFAYAADSDLWTQFSTVTIGDTNLEFSHSSAFLSSQVFIAALPMYPFSRTQRLISEWAANGYVSSPDSAAISDYIIGYATARDAGDGSGRISPALPFYALKISSGAGTKNKAVLISGNHPHETPGRFALEGAITWLLGGSALANFFLNYFDIWIYPCVSPQGVYSGYFRSSPETPASDNNRIWNTTGTNEAIDAIKAAITTDTGGVIEVGVDFHGEMSADTVFGYAIDNTAALAAAYAAKHTALEATFDLRNLTTAGTTSKLFNDDYGAALSLTIEQGAAAARTIAQYKNSGAYTLQAIAQTLAAGYFTNNAGVGSRDFNGASDRIDWASVANLTGAAFTISAWVNLDANADNDYILCIHDSGDGSYGIVVNIIATNKIDLIRHGAGDYLWFHDVNTVTTGVWHHILITSDGGLLSGSVAIYQDGVSKTVGFTNGSGAETAHTGKWSIGGRVYSDTRNFDGKIAQVRVFNRVLTPAEIALEAGGVVTTVNGLIYYWKGNTASLAAAPGGDGTADGTTQLTGVGNGPSIVYP